MRKLNRINKTKRKYYVVGTICIAMFFMMGIGYAILSQQLDISGTAQITSTWKILFTSAEEKEMNNATTISKQIVNQTTLNLNVELNQPGASATYDVVVENQGDLDAMLTAINGVDEANNQDPKSIKVELQNIRVNDALLAGDKKTFQVKVYWDSSVDFDDVNMSKDVQISLVYEQREASEIPSPLPSIDITDEVVTSGDGLYVDQYEPGRYIYRGSEPNNYILFNNELWRIMAKEIDGTYKIIRDEMIGKMAYDSIGYRTPENNTFCSAVLSGCSPFGKVNGDFILGSNDRGTVTEDSEIAQYLNHEYYDTLSEISKSQIQLHDFKIGGIVLNEDEYSGDLLFEIYSEADYKWAGNVGLINLTDYLRASISPSCEHTTYDYRVPNSCTSNYLIDSLENTQYWTLTPFVFVDGIARSIVYVISSYEGEKHATTNIVEDSETTYVRPVVFLKSSIKLSGGTGTETDPYIIAE